MKPFMDNDFLLTTDTARKLFHDYANPMPILDYHCHIDPKEIAQDRQFSNITQVWLGGDHYKWRFMRSCGVEEHFITGNAPDKEKFNGRNVWELPSEIPYTTGPTWSCSGTSATPDICVSRPLRKSGNCVTASFPTRP